MLLPSLKYTWITIGLQMFSNPLPKPLMYASTMWMLLSLLCLHVCCLWS